MCSGVFIQCAVAIPLPIQCIPLTLEMYGKRWLISLAHYSETFEKRTIWEQYKIEPFCNLLKDCLFSRSQIHYLQNEILGFL